MVSGVRDRDVAETTVEAEPIMMAGCCNLRPRSDVAFCLCVLYRLKNGSDLFQIWMASGKVKIKEMIIVILKVSI